MKSQSYIGEPVGIIAIHDMVVDKHLQLPMLYTW
jgi:hypothetical protein